MTPYGSFSNTKDFFYPYDKNHKDPFSPLIDNYGIILIPKETDITGMSLNGIIYSENDPVVIISGEVLRVEDRIGDFVVSEIDRKRVILKKGSEIFTLELEGE